MKKEIMWRNEKWIVDYGTGTIYKKAPAFEDDPNLITVQARFGDYPFGEFKGSIYFKDSSNFYKIIDDEVAMISKEEYDEQKKFKKLNVKDIDNVRYISIYVSSVIIDEVLSAKHNIRISTKVENSNVVPIISNKFPSIIKSRINDISRSIISTLHYVDRTIVKQEVKKALSSMFENDNGYISEMINSIYENDKIRFDQLATDIRNQIDERNQRMNTNTPDSNGFVFSDGSTLITEEDTLGRKIK